MHDDFELPPWAKGMMCSANAGDPSPAEEAGRAEEDWETEHRDPLTDLSFFAGPGVYTVPVDRPSREKLRRATQLLKRLMRHPLDMGALVLADAAVLHPTEVHRLTCRGIEVLVPDLPNKDVHAAALAYMRQARTQQQRGDDHLSAFLGHMRTIHQGSI